MPVLSEWKLDISTDDVLWAQGSDPAIIRKRSPRIVDIAEQVVIEGSQYLRPTVVYEIYDIERVLHHKLELSQKGLLKSPLVTEHLGAAQQVAVVGYTVGIELENGLPPVRMTLPGYDPSIGGSDESFYTSLRYDLFF